MSKGEVLVTGGAGFVGREVVKQLLRKKYDVVVADRKEKKYSPSDKCIYLEFNLTDKKLAKKAMRGVDYCLHLASESGGIGFTRRHPATILSENNKINAAVFEAAAEENIKRIVYISSSMVFENAKKFPVKEDDLAKIQTPKTGYSFSKLMGERLCASFWDEFGLEYAIVRPSNIYGTGSFLNKEEGFAHVIPDFTRKIVSGNYPLEIYGDGQQTRCFIHVSDIAAGIIAAMESPNGMNQDFNICASEETKIIDLAQMLYRMCGNKKPFKSKHLKSFPDDVKRNYLSNEKAKRLLDWRPVRKFDVELEKIVKWVKKSIAVSGSV